MIASFNNNNDNNQNNHDEESQGKQPCDYCLNYVRRYLVLFGDNYETGLPEVTKICLTCMVKFLKTEFAKEQNKNTNVNYKAGGGNKPY